MITRGLELGAQRERFSQTIDARFRIAAVKKRFAGEVELVGVARIESFRLFTSFERRLDDLFEQRELLFERGARIIRRSYQLLAHVRIVETSRPPRGERADDV